MATYLEARNPSRVTPCRLASARFDQTDAESDCRMTAARDAPDNVAGASQDVSLVRTRWTLGLTTVWCNRPWVRYHRNAWVRLIEAHRSVAKRVLLLFLEHRRDLGVCLDRGEVRLRGCQRIRNRCIVGVDVTSA